MTTLATSSDELVIKVVTTAEQRSDAMLVRALCFADGEKIPLRNLTDGNDFQATHFVAYVKDEPVGSARVRWFRDFAKFERSCLTPKYRNVRSLYTVARETFRHIELKGFDKVITYASPKYASIWCRILGFRETSNRSVTLSMDEQPYIELVKNLNPTSESISMQSPPELLERIEGFWDTPVSYERPPQ